MLTISWKQTRTSIEVTPPPNITRNEESENLPAPSDIILGAQFIRPRARHDPFYHEKNNTSSLVRVDKKRRKFINDNSELGVDMEPILCLTSPHRVVFVDTNASGTKSAENFLVESKSRNYVTRPGPTSRFSLCGNSRNYTANRINFGGMLSPGAQYDPASNLIYAIRNGGTEVAIWTAAPSSTLPGPDEKGNERVTNGRIFSAEGEKNEVLKTMMPKKRKKWQSMQQQQQIQGAVISQHLKIPAGSLAMTLTPFAIPESSSLKGKGKLAVVGAAGCCKDGSIWVAACFPPSCHFELLIVKGSSIDNAKCGINVDEGQKASLKAHSVRKAAWVLLGSCVTGEVSYSITSGDSNNKPSVLLPIRSVFLSKDEKSQVVFRSHQVRIHKKESRDRKLSAFIEKSTMQDILQLHSCNSDVAVHLEMDTDSLSIIHRKSGDRWMFTLINFSQSDGALVKLMRTFPLPYDGLKHTATLFSFGRVGLNTVAVLLKSQSTKEPKNSVLSLRIIDFQRMAELSSLRWTDGDDATCKESRYVFGDNVKDAALQGKQCHAMITNEFDGSIVLFMSSKEDIGSVDILFSKLEMRNSSLAFALDSKASLLSNTIGTISSKVHTGRLNSNLARRFSSEADKIYVCQGVVDDAVDKACKLMATSSKDLIDLILRSSETDNGLITNGTSPEGSITRERIGSSISWRKVYQEASMLIVHAKEQHLNHNSLIRNVFKVDIGNLVELKSVTNGELPKRFIKVAFKETANILVLLHKKAASSQAQKALWKSIQESTSILFELLQTNLISAREDYGVGFLHHGHILLVILRASSTISLSDIYVGTVGKLHIIDAMLEHVRDIPEDALVSFLRFVLINVKAEDAVAFYSTTPQTSLKATSLSNQYKESLASQKDSQKHAGTRLLSEALLDFTSKIVTYSYCNHFFLTKAMLANVNASDEVETILLTLAKLLRLGSTCNAQKDKNECTKNTHSNMASLSLGTIQWILALTDAHTDTIFKTVNEGGLIIDRVKSAVRNAMVQSENANEIRDISDLIMSMEVASVVTKSTDTQSRSCETVIAAYSVERLVF